MAVMRIRNTRIAFTAPWSTDGFEQIPQLPCPGILRPLMAVAVSRSAKLRSAIMEASAFGRTLLLRSTGICRRIRQRRRPRGCKRYLAELLECAAGGCSMLGTLECGGCRTVRYCSRACQRVHRRAPRRIAESPSRLAYQISGEDA